ncbi:MAG: thioredoxin family protein [Treponema sp.]|nr:thioredoxin family protein [Treponema sp.]
MKSIRLIKAAALVLTAALCTGLVSCSKKTYTSFEEAQKAAQKEKKEILLLFTGCDWDEHSEDFKAQVVNTKEFEKAFNKNYVFVNVDLSQDDFLSTNLPDDASEKEKEDAKKILEDFSVKEELSRTYQVTQYPSVYFLTREGWFLGIVNFAPNHTSFVEFNADVPYQEIKQKMETVNKIRSTTGVEKAKAIDDLFTATPSVYATPMHDLILSFPELDPQNETGMLENYKLNAIYFKAYDELKTGGNASLVFASAAEDEALNLSGPNRQQLYQMAAYMLVQDGSLDDNYDYDKILDYLQKAYEADPESEDGQLLYERLQTARSEWEKVKLNNAE